MVRRGFGGGCLFAFVLGQDERWSLSFVYDNVAPDEWSKNFQGGFLVLHGGVRWFLEFWNLYTRLLYTECIIKNLGTDRIDGDEGASSTTSAGTRSEIHLLLGGVLLLWRC